MLLIFQPLRALAALLCLLPALALAQPSANYVARLAALETAVATLTQAALDQKAALAAQQTTIASQAGTIALLQDALTHEIADRKSYADGAAAATLVNAKAYSDGRLAPVSDKLLHFSRSGNNVLITGANVYVRNGMGSTVNNGFNGLGNLIVGYNEGRNQGSANPDVRTGSHNLIVGVGANYARNASIITGINNSSANNFASVYGGTGNYANATYSVVVGGYNNQTNGGWSTILGGRDRTAANQLDHLP
jgi:hypothetical protein